MAKYLANELNANERADFESKLIQNEQLRLELEAYALILDLSSNDEQPEFNPSSAWDRVKERTQESKVVPLKRPNFNFLKIAATLLILVTAGYFIITSMGSSETTGTELASASSEVREFTLPDGSNVKLNANAKITLAKHFGDSNRRITLTGEGNFDIVRNEQLPFIIEAGNSTVTVLGTSFNLSTEQEGVELNVTEGLVEFSSVVSGVSEKVAQGESAKLDDNGGTIVKKPSKNTNYSGWWTRRLEYDETPLREVFEDLESTYWVEISYSQAIGNCNLNATFEGKPLNDIIELITETFENVTLVSNKENRIKLEGKGCTN